MLLIKSSESLEVHTPFHTIVLDHAFSTSIKLKMYRRQRNYTKMSDKYIRHTRVKYNNNVFTTQAVIKLKIVFMSISFSSSCK